MNSRLERVRNLMWVTIIALALLANPAMAVDDDGLFELDGNAQDDAGVLGDDWDSPPLSGGAFEFTGIKADPAPESIFTGGRKDIQPISQWAHKNGAVPDKDDITNAYAAAYNNGGDLIVYFGADRFANVGDAFLGFWFFAGEVAALPDGSFSGAHTEDDTLVLVDYPQASGAQPLISVLNWDPSCAKAASNNPIPGECGAKNLRLKFDSQALCGPGGPSDDVCAIANLTASPSPWSYIPKAGVSGTFPPESFFEGGINLTEIVGDVCFSSFMAETRSSSSFTASLKDFVLDSFEVCGISITKSCTDVALNASETGFEYTFNGAVTNDGFGTVWDVTITDDNGTPADLSDDFVIDIPSIAAGESVPYNGTFETAGNGVTNTVSVTAAAIDGGAQTISAGPVMAECPTLQLSPMMSVTKDCTTSVVPASGLVAVKVDFSGMVCNTSAGATAVRLDNVSVTDDAGTPADAADDQTFPLGSLEAGQCKPYSGDYLPGSVNSSNPGSAMFSDEVHAVGTAPLGFGSAQASDSASCPLCPPEAP